MSALLYKPLRTFQIYGSNTQVGKTVWSTILCTAAKKLHPLERVTYLKPVSTGPDDEADNSHVERFCKGKIETVCLHQYELPVSPHLAARTSKQFVPSDIELLSGIQDAALRLSQDNGWLFVETAGGVHSPGPSGTTQADLYAPLRLPVVLIGDAKLGGISQTISAYESLKLRGYEVPAVLVFGDETYKNHEYLSTYFDKDAIVIESVPGPHDPLSSREDEFRQMSTYYDSTSSLSTTSKIISHLKQHHENRIARLQSMATTASQKIWYPFTQHKLLSDDKITVIDSAHGNDFQTFSNSEKSLLRSTFDGSASWWTQGLGHANPQLTLSAAYAAGRYGHVMFAEAIHEPALALAERLLSGMQNSRLNRVFYSDNGSTGMEVAVKMGLRASRLRYGWKADDPIEVLGLKGSYHGDTIGAMNCTEPNTYNEEVEWYEGKGFWFDYPTIRMTNGEWKIDVPAELQSELGAGSTFDNLASIFDLERRNDLQAYETFITKTLERLQRQGRKFGTLMLEPVVLGAGGMLLVDPLFQRTLVETVRNFYPGSGLPVIFDEVFTGLYRLGHFSSSSLLGVEADISVHAKLLTGGLLPLCATLANEEIFKAFESDDKTDALLHGHSYTAHPIGCQVAIESVEEFQKMEKAGAWQWAKDQGWGTGKVWSVWNHQFIDGLSRKDEVQGVWALGSVLAIHLRDVTGGSGYTSQAARKLQTHLLKGSSDGNVHSRVLGNVLYIMTGQKTSQSEVKKVEELIKMYFA